MPSPALLGGHAPREEQDSASGQASPPFVHHKNRRNQAGVTGKRILGSSPSRKTAFCDPAYPTPHGKPHSDRVPHQKAHSACEQSRRVFLSVRYQLQNAPFREMCNF